MNTKKVQIVEKILDANDQIALENQQVFDSRNILGDQYHGLSRRRENQHNPAHN